MPSASATSPTTSPDPYSRPEGSDRDYTPDCEEPDNPERLRNEATFARLCGVAPIPTGSGKTDGYHRLNRGGDRALNRAIHTIAVTRMRSCARTRSYVERRTAEGKSQREIRRCLKRYIARELYRTLTTTIAPAATA